jgi:hypothetical protein
MHDRLSGPRGGVSRRRFLRLGLTGLAGVITTVGPASRLSAATTIRRWSDPNTWGGKVPGREDVAVVTGTVLLDVDARVAGVRIRRWAKLVFDPTKSVRLTTTGNVVVRGRLTMRPESPTVIHRLIFTGIRESRFKGGGHEVLDSDVGLWVMGFGVLDIAGSPKLAWTRATGSLAPGANAIQLRDDPVGWQVGDRLVVTPTVGPQTTNHYAAYDFTVVASIVGRTITLSQPMLFPHPSVDVGRGNVMTAEVLNLSRNVRIGGTSKGRTHVFIHSMRRQSVKHAALQHVGPRKAWRNRPPYTKPVLGRYGLHFHECEDDSRGSLVEGCVIHSAGNHAFVAHMSHGVTFRDCISHDTFEDPYWWDPRPGNHPEMPGPPTDDALYERCVASLVRCDPPFEGYRMSGFFLGARNRNVIRNCVAVGVLGSDTSCGYIWPELSVGVWTFEDCVAHNNKVHGIFVWQNNPPVHLITRFIAYHNGASGIMHGAYRNRYRYEDSILFANRVSAIELWALSVLPPELSFVNVLCDQAGLSDYCVRTKKHTLPGLAPALFQACHFRGDRKAAFGFEAPLSTTDPNNFNPEIHRVVNCSFEGNEFWLAGDIRPESLIQVQDGLLGTLQLRRADQPGVPRPEWNASVTALP